MSEEKITSEQGLSKAPVWRLRAPRVLAGAVGLILLTAGLLKAMDMELFIGQIRDYGIISHRVLLTLSAWGLITLECTLGVGLLVFYRPRLILSLTAMLLLIFVGATGWAWLTGATEDCGCFGAWLKHTPGEAAVGNLILLAATALAWVVVRHLQTSQTRAKAWAVATACLIGLALPLSLAFPIPGINRPQSKTVGVKLGDLQIQGIDHIDLNQGAYLIILIGTDCLHCQEVLPELNMLAEESDLPALIALCTNEESQRMMFVEEFQPAFPIGQISEDDFWCLLGDADVPRIILVRDGCVQQVWNKTVPKKERIKKE